MNCQVAEEGFNFRPIHLAGMALSLKEDEALHRVCLGFFATAGIVLDTQGVANLIEEFGSVGWHGYGSVIR